jgi:hypothetical protein
MANREELHKALEVVARTDGAERVQASERVAQIAGELAFSGTSREIVEDERTLRNVRVDLATLDLSDLTTGAHALRTLTVGFQRTDALVAYLRQLLERRTHVEKLRRGASTMLGHTFPWSPQQEEHVRAFDDAAEEVLFRLVAINDVRSELLRDVAPSVRESLFWLARGVDLPLDAADRMKDVAALVAQFAPARAAFDDLVRNQQRSQGSTRRIARGFTLDAWLADRNEGEEAIANTEHYELGFTFPATLTLRVRSPLRNTERPELRTANAEVPMEPAAGRRTHFEHAIDGKMRFASSLSLVIPFASGEEVIDVLAALKR